MRTPYLASALLIATLLATNHASADILPDGAKGVRLSMRVDGAVPSGQVLVLAHTFRGADVVELGKVSPVEWHPLGGKLRLVLVKSTEASKLEQIRKDMNRDAANAMTDAATPCGDEFMGVRTLPDTSPADEVRWIFTVKAEGGACTGTLLRTEYFAKNGTPVSLTPGEPPPSPAPEPSAAPAPSVAATPTGTAPSAPATEPSPSSASTPARGSCGACAAGAEAPAGTGALFLAAALAALRARRKRA